MRYKFYTNSESAWQAMFETISSAKESVSLEMYIFIDDMKAINFLELLAKKAREGVRVSIVLDSFGSADMSSAGIRTLRDSGAEVFFFSHLLHRTHRKILIIDERIAFIGGVNFHQNTRYWNDLAVKVEGPLVRHAARSFAKTYQNSGGSDPRVLRLAKSTLKKSIRMRFVEHFPDKRRILKKIYLEHISHAQKRVFLVTPYFMPKRWLAFALHQAVIRGANVEVIVPAITDYYILDRVNYFYMHRLAKLGVSFYLTRSMNHAKVMLIDDTEGMVGSQNLDILSFEWNAEAGVFFNDAGAVRQLAGIFGAWREKADFFDFKKYRPKFWDYVLAPVIAFFGRIF